MPTPLQVFIGPEDTMQTKIIKPKNDVADSLRFVDYARERSYNMQNLLKREIASTFHFFSR